MPFLMMAAVMLLLSACNTGGAMSSFTTGYVTQDPDSMPDMAWQTNGQRREMAQRPSLQTVDGTAPLPGKKVAVSILLPLTGKNANLGQSMLKAAQMALFDVGSPHFELVPRDTQSTAQGAVAAARDAVAANNDMILGPIFADDVRAAKPVAAQAGIPMIAFTTDSTLAGSGTYVMGFMPHSQVARVVTFAQGKGLDKLAVLAPQTEYCDIVLGALSRTGASVVKSQRYSPSQSDLSVIVADFAQQTKAYGAKALMLPVGGESLRSITAFLDQSGIDSQNIKFLGTGLWDDESLTGNPALYGSWFAAPDPATRRDFERRYNENYGSAPVRLSSLAYDATAMAAVLARGNKSMSSPYSSQSLTHARGFAGIDGIFRFRGDGLNERGLAVLEIHQGRARVVDPAPTAFISPGM
jgi:ABC-type branched-subunit amino acid transport system substrate-binding protein